MAVKYETVVVFISVGIIAVDFDDFGDETPTGTAFEVHNDVYGVADIGFDRAKAKVRPATTIATSERPRAIVLVKAVWSALTAFSHGEVPVCASAGHASTSKAIESSAGRRASRKHSGYLGVGFMKRISSPNRIRGEFSPPKRATGRNLSVCQTCSLRVPLLWETPGAEAPETVWLSGSFHP